VTKNVESADIREKSLKEVPREPAGNSRKGGTFAVATGTVKWFNNAKGYGFILRDGSEEDLFAHFSSIQMDGYRTLKAGQAVEFDVTDGPKGLCAVNIQALDSDDSDSESEDSTDIDNISVNMQNIDDDGESGEHIEEITIEDVPEALNEVG
jgi:CspA family cold shock protein